MDPLNFYRFLRLSQWKWNIFYEIPDYSNNQIEESGYRGKKHYTEKDFAQDAQNIEATLIIKTLILWVEIRRSLSSSNLFLFFLSPIVVSLQPP